MSRLCKWFGHKFEARYDTSEAIIPAGLAEITVAALKTLRRETYVHDVCVRCGCQVSRTHTPEGKEIPQ